MEIFPVHRMKVRLGVTILACFLFSLPFIVTGRALIVVPFVFAAGGIYYFLIYYSRYRKRREIARQPLSVSDRKILEENVSFYTSLSGDNRKTYEADMAIFLAEHTITGIDDVK
ncbi:MAG: hypothetical protein GF388_05080, partial [Candidatus Aegiribacteria sp.]|nr:hypothetical protein [Candidatus Aegiribacteria sp.]